MAGPFDIFGEDTASNAPVEPLSAEAKARLEELERRIIGEKERARLEGLLLDRLKRSKTDLEKLLQEMSSH